MAHENDLWCVGVLYDSQKDLKAGKVSGYRIYGCAVEGYKDVSADAVKQQLIQHPGRVRGLQISPRTGEIMGSCGDIGTYPKLVQGSLVAEQREMILIGRLPQSGVKVFYLNDCHWVDYTSLRKLVEVHKVKFANAVLSGSEDRDFDAIATLDGIEVGYYDPQDTDKSGRAIKELYDESAKFFGFAVDEAETRHKIASKVKGEEWADEILEKVLETARESGLRIINRTMDDTGGIYLKNAQGATVEDRLIRASRVLRKYSPFMYSAWSAMRKIDTYDTPTAAVSLREFLYNPSFINSLSDSCLQYTIEHEMSHVLMEHVARSADRQPDVWNIACDLSVNARIDYEHGLRFIGDECRIRDNTGSDGAVFLESTISSMLGGCSSTKIDLDNDTATSLYFEILEEMEKQKTSSSLGKVGSSKKGASEDQEADGGHDDGNTVIFRGERITIPRADIVTLPEEASMSKASLEQASKNFLLGIVERHKRQFGSFGGESGGYYERIVEAALAPRVQWKSAIRKRFMDICGRDRSYRTPDRRFASRGLYLAGSSAQIPDMLKNLKICFDMSGSIGSQDVGVCLAQLEQLLKEFKCDTAELLFWDTQIRERVEFKDYKELLKKARYSGGGGTDCNCVFAEFESEPYKNRKKKAPGYIIIFTDGVFGPIGQKYKKYGNNTIWVLPDFAALNFTAPFGLKSEFAPTDTKAR